VNKNDYINLEANAERDAIAAEEKEFVK